MAEVTLELTRSQAIMVAFLVSEFYLFMVTEGIPDVAIGQAEVSDLVDKLYGALRDGLEDKP